MFKIVYAFFLAVEAELYANKPHYHPLSCLSTNTVLKHNERLTCLLLHCFQYHLAGSKNEMHSLKKKKQVLEYVLERPQ